MNETKPELGQTFYFISQFAKIAFEDTVEYVGKDSFLDKWMSQRLYKDDGITWCASLEDLRKAYPNARYDEISRCYLLEEAQTKETSRKGKPRQ